MKAKILNESKNESKFEMGIEIRRFKTGIRRGAIFGLHNAQFFPQCNSKYCHYCLDAV